LQVESFLQDHAHFAALILIGGAMLAPFSGCGKTPSADVVATVNSKDILRSELERQYQIVKMSQGQAPQDPSPEQADLARLAILRQMIDEEIMQQRAAKLNVAASDEDVQAKLTEMKLPFTQEEFDKQLQQRKETMDDLKREIRRGETVKKLTNKEIDAKINITDAEITGFYAAHKPEYNIMEPRYGIARIVVSSNPSSQTNNLQNNKAAGDVDAKNKIQALHKKLENGEDFGALAMNFSEDKDTASNGGDMGFIPESQLHDAEVEVYNAISKLKPGEFTDVFPIANPASHKVEGYAIYKLISKEAAGQRTLNNVQVQAAIRQNLRDGHAQLLKTAWLEKLRDEAKVHNYLADQILNEGAK
jgi:peptidyl-prolyl cis-trans isomerase SurA